MKLILILSFLFTFSAQASEVKLFLDRPSILTGELISGKVDGYLGPEIHEKMLEDSVYIVHLSEERADLVFMKPMSSNTISLNEKDYLVWNPIEIIPVEAPEEAYLENQPFELTSYRWLLMPVLLVFFLCLGVMVYFKKIRPSLSEKKYRRTLKNDIFSSEDIESITAIWKEKQRYLEAFPFMEEHFNKFEVVYYQYAFKPQLSEEEKKEIIRSYQRMLDQIRGGKFGV